MSKIKTPWGNGVQKHPSGHWCVAHLTGTIAQSSVAVKHFVVAVGDE